MLKNPTRLIKLHNAIDCVRIDIEGLYNILKKSNRVGNLLHNILYAVADLRGSRGTGLMKKVMRSIYIYYS